MLIIIESGTVAFFFFLLFFGIKGPKARALLRNPRQQPAVSRTVEHSRLITKCIRESYLIVQIGLDGIPERGQNLVWWRTIGSSSHFNVEARPSEGH